MEMIIVRVLLASVGLYLVDLLTVGFVCGFAVFLLACIATALLFCGYYRLVVARKPTEHWRWERFGSAMYRMEVA